MEKRGSLRNILRYWSYKPLFGWSPLGKRASFCFRDIKSPLVHVHARCDKPLAAHVSSVTVYIYLRPGVASEDIR